MPTPLMVSSKMRGVEIVAQITCTMQAILIVSKSAPPKKAHESLAVGVSPERVGRDTGRPLVLADHSGHDAARVSHLQGIFGILRADRDKYTGGQTAQA
jgi:hypothetical protein